MPWISRPDKNGLDERMHTECRLRLLGRRDAAHSSQLFGVDAIDALTVVSVPVVLLGAALLACHIPARRASRVEMIAALKYE